MKASFFVSPFDVLDEGLDVVLGNIQERAKADGVIVPATYHASRDVFPHNPRRKVITTEAGSAYFRPDPTKYARLALRPEPSPAIVGRDLVAEVCEGARKRGLSVQVWTLFLHVDSPHPQLCPKNAFGDHYLSDLCPAHPEVRAYAAALATDVARYESDGVLVESLHYHPLGHGTHHERLFGAPGHVTRFLLSLCFCEHCKRAAAEVGVDPFHAEAVTRRFIEESFTRPYGADPSKEQQMPNELAGYLEARLRTVMSLMGIVRDRLSKAGRSAILFDIAGASTSYLNGSPQGLGSARHAIELGLDLREIVSAGWMIEAPAYARTASRVCFDLQSYLDYTDTPTAVVPVLRPMHPDCESPENLLQKVQQVRDLGCARCDFYHYGFMSLDALDWVRAALES